MASNCARTEIMDGLYWAAVRNVDKIVSDLIEHALNLYNTDWNRVEKHLNEFSAAFSRRIFNEGSIYAGNDRQLAYLIGYGPRSARSLYDILCDLYVCGLVPPHSRILDIGSGCGATALALAYFGLFVNNRRRKFVQSDHEEPVSFNVTFVDHVDEAAAMRDFLVEGLNEGLRSVKISHENISCDLSSKSAGDQLTSSGIYDLVILSGVLNEIPQSNKRMELLRIASEVLNETGNMIIVESGLSPERSFPFRQECLQLRDQMSLTLHSPCAFDCSAPYCWTYRKNEMVHWPAATAKNWRGLLREYRYSHMVFRKDGRKRILLDSSAKLADFRAKNLSLEYKVLFSNHLHNWQIGSYLVICDGKSSPVWVNPPQGSYSMKPGFVYRLLASKPKWSRFNANQWILDIGDGQFIGESSCSQYVVSPGTTIEDEKMGRLEVLNRGCRCEIPVRDQYGASMNYDLEEAIESHRVRICS